MTKLSAVLACLLFACSEAAFALSPQFVTKAFLAEPGTTAVIDIMCPPGQYATSSAVSADPGNRLTNSVEVYLDVQGRQADASIGLNSGIRFSTTNTGATRISGTVTLACWPIGADIYSRERLAAVAANGTVKVDGLCNPGDVPVGQVSNADGKTLQRRSRMSIFVDSFGAYSFLEDLPDGETAPPVGIQQEFSNPTSTTQTARLQTACKSIAGARTFVSSAATANGQQFSLAGDVPDTYDVYDYSAVGGLYGLFSSFAIWGKDGSVSSQARFASPTGELPPTEPRNFFIDGVDARPKSGTNPSARAGTEASARAVIGILAVPRATPPPAPNIVTVVEFYNQALDHYFITASPDEISKLDTGVFAGWQRTQQSFKAYAPGSSGPPGRRPVCRDYGDPLVGLDSHFYSASPAECAATLSNFNGAWLFEASEVFQMQLPDVVTGACPAGSAPVYRLWNQRADSNHRYVTTIALRDQMVAKGYVAEGYGPNAVTLCASV